MERTSDKPLSEPLAGPTYKGFATSAPLASPAPAATAQPAPQPAPQPPPQLQPEPVPVAAPARRRFAGAGLVAAGAAAAGALIALLWPAGLLAPGGPGSPAADPAPRPAAPTAAPRLDAETALPPPPTTEISAPAPAPPVAAAPRREAKARRPFEPCATREPPVAQLLCRNPQLASLDRQVNAAFARAMRGSAAPGQLASDQERWIVRRDRAARETPDAVADIYRERIAVLQAGAGEPAPQAALP